MRIRVLLADDSVLVRKVIAELLKRDPEIELVGECGNFEQTMQLAAELRPQVVILDVHTGDERVMTPSELKSGLIGSRLLAISVWQDDETKTLRRLSGLTRCWTKQSWSLS